MTLFNEREKAFEDRFAHDEAMRFNARALCTRMLGRWAAEQLGKSGSAAEEYATGLISMDLKEPGYRQVVRKVAEDFHGRHTEDEIRAKLAEFLPLATAQVLSERP